ncbi:MAG: 50S ribosomal protein L13 [Bacteroidetes bacterium]|nr:50S ribosomal protein L13 [Bacteroidota bacterium]
MDTLSYKTISANKSSVNKNWYVVDATNQSLGRLSSHVAKIVRGKNKTYFSPHIDCGDHVIVLNADKVRLTGKKWTQKEYVRHTGYPGGQRIDTPEEIHRKFPERLIERAVKGMLPKNRLGNQIAKNLHVYSGDQHPHEAQQPKQLDLNTIK